jgi:hypothetical protein
MNFSSGLLKKQTGIISSFLYVLKRFPLPSRMITSCLMRSISYYSHFNADCQARFETEFKIVIVETICILRTTAPSRELASFIIVILPFSRVHSVCITPVFCAHGTANFHLKLLSVCNRKACISAFSSKYRLFNSGGQRGIRIFIKPRFRL